MLPCDQICSYTPLLLHGHVFSVVLDIQWFKQLGPIITNYDTLTM